MDEGDFDFNIVIVGLGLIGGSYAMALRELKPRQICAIDRDERVLEQAFKMGVIDKCSTDGKSFLKEADLIIIALYPEETVKFVSNNKENFKDGAVITDVCGIKMGVVEKINGLLPQSIDFIGGHPMAGKESKGLQAASKDIFKNANYIITPAEGNKKENIDLIEKMARSMGCKNAVCLTPEEHDKIISYTSHLPHVIAVALMNSNMIENVGMFVAGSFKDATRVANINSILWSELFTLNSESLVTEIEKFEQSIREIKKAIKSEDKDEIISILKNASEKRRKMVGI